MDNPDIRETPRQFVDVIRQILKLVQDEIALARAEVSKNLSRAVLGFAFICVAALVALVALNVLASALVGVLAAYGFPLWASAFIIGISLLVVAAVLVVLGAKRLSVNAVIPSRTIDNIDRDLSTLKEASND